MDCCWLRFCCKVVILVGLAGIVVGGDRAGVGLVGGFRVGCAGAGRLGIDVDDVEGLLAARIG